MALTRDALQAHLEHLDAAVDGPLASEGDHFIVAFAGIADAIADAAGAGGMPVVGLDRPERPGPGPAEFRGHHRRARARVAAAGHDRTIINIKPEHIDAWLNPRPGELATLYAIFDDKQHPFYEHRIAA